MATNYYDKIVSRFMKEPTFSIFSPTEYRVVLDGWHVHNGGHRTT